MKPRHEKDWEALPVAIGKKELLNHWRGRKLTYRQGVFARCYECMGYYTDGKMDCIIPDCPLHPWMPYRNK